MFALCTDVGGKHRLGGTRSGNCFRSICLNTEERKREREGEDHSLFNATLISLRYTDSFEMPPRQFIHPSFHPLAVFETLLASLPQKKTKTHCKNGYIRLLLSLHPILCSLSSAEVKRSRQSRQSNKKSCRVLDGCSVSMRCFPSLLTSTQMADSHYRQNTHGIEKRPTRDTVHKEEECNFVAAASHCCKTDQNVKHRNARSE